MSQSQAEVVSEESANLSVRPSTSISSINTVPPPKKKVRAVGPVAKQNELLTLACQYLSQTRNEGNDDDSLAIAKVWANKLKNLAPLQMLLAEKAINDILFEAQLGNLNKDSIQINRNVSYSPMYSSKSSVAPTPTPPSLSSPPEYTPQTDYNQPVNPMCYSMSSFAPTPTAPSLSSPEYTPQTNYNKPVTLATLFSTYSGQ